MAISIFKALKRRSKTYTPVPKKIWSHPLYFLGFGLGSGAIPIAPGTFGTLMAVPIYLLAAPLPLAWYLVFVLSFIIVSSWISDYLSKKLKVHDHPGVNIDEFAGYFVTMIHAPAGWGWVIMGFVLFRLFDIWKPWPINLVDRQVHGGFGMVLDDVLAGLLAMVCLQFVAVMS